ncbi:MAG: phosphoribosyl-AMP cyclohydrolase [Capsulimonadaceae bacterium]|nr:phosphoribosyl-AMP cyclohydrolase [Capsulimonadaceae bacterium]
MSNTLSAVKEIVEAVKFDRNPEGLAPAIVQDATTKDVLMVGFMNPLALTTTLETGNVTFWSRSRKKLWTKGETSGHFLKFVALRVNCNEDSVLVFANPIGPTCHTGHPTCYFREAQDGGDWKQITEPLFDPKDVYKP